MAPHLHINAPSPAPFICILDLSRSGGDKSLALRHLLPRRVLLLAIQLHLSLSVSKDFPTTKTIPLSSSSSWNEEREGESKRVIKRDKRHATISILSLSLSLVSSESLSQSRPLLAFQRRRKSGNACHARSSLIRIGYGETRKLIRWNFPLFPSRLERETVKEARRQGL